MKLIGALFVLAAVGVGDVHPAKILSFNTFNSTSHHMWMTSLMSALARRGHQVTHVDFVSPKKNTENMRTLIIGEAPLAVQKFSERFMEVLASGTTLQKIEVLQEMELVTCESTYERSPYKELLSAEFNETFDLILYNYNLQDCLFGFIHRFGYPAVVLAAPFSTNPHWMFRAMNTPVFHAVPHYFDEFNMPLTLFQRLKTLVSYLYDDYRYRYNYAPKVDAVLRQKVGPDVPSVLKLVERAAVALVNIPASDYKVPLPANVIPVGGLHLAAPKPLPAELKEFLDGAKDGAILMSFGSIVRGDSIDPEKRKAILKTFSGIRQRVLWKWESAGDPNASLPEVPANVKLHSWLPQNDILAHPNMRLFISHCGGMSSLESAYHGVPVLAMPFFLDQLSTADRLVAEGRGLRLDMKDVNEQSFEQTLKDLVQNPKYREAATGFKVVLQEQPQHPLERALFWVEFAIRHKNAPHMRSPVADLPWLQYSLVLDVVLLFFGLAVSLRVAVAVLLFAGRSFSRQLTSSSTSSASSASSAASATASDKKKKQ